MNRVLTEISTTLSRAGIESPRLEAKRILSFVCNKDENEIALMDDKLSPKEVKKIAAIITQRLAHKPLDKILGTKGFYKYDFVVNEDVLSPRPDTEVLVEEALKLLPQEQKVKIIDFGTGSGCILLSLLAEGKNAYGQGIDISSKALLVAKKNADILELSNRVKWINSDWFDENLPELLDSPVDMIVSNPPYIPTQDIASLEDDVKNYDPMSALDGGEDGLCHYRQIASITPSLLKKGGYVLLEVGINQAQAVAEIFEQAGLNLVKIVSDLGQIERCVILKK